MIWKYEHPGRRKLCFTTIWLRNFLFKKNKHNLLTFNVYQVVTYQKGGGHEIISLLQVIKPQATSLLSVFSFKSTSDSRMLWRGAGKMGKASNVSSSSPAGLKGPRLSDDIYSSHFLHIFSPAVLKIQNECRKFFLILVHWWQFLLWFVNFSSLKTSCFRWCVFF